VAGCLLDFDLEPDCMLFSYWEVDLKWAGGGVGATNGGYGKVLAILLLYLWELHGLCLAAEKVGYDG
jgi:hypothetical protein